MKISTKGQYALEIIVDLAMHSDEQHLESLKNIAERRKLSEKYLERIINLLKDAKLVKSVRGAYGGYCLGKPMQEMTVLDVLIASEGAMAPVACLLDEIECAIGKEACPTRATWELLWKEILYSAMQVTIADLIEQVEDEKE